MPIELSDESRRAAVKAIDLMGATRVEPGESMVLLTGRGVISLADDAMVPIIEEASMPRSQPRCAPSSGGFEPTARRPVRTGARRERGQALIEMAVVFPLLLVVMFGIIQCGILFNNWVMLTDAVRVGSRQLAISRAPGQDGCVLAVASLKAAAAGLNPANLAITYTVTDSCTNLLAGSEATLRATYPCDLAIMGVDFVPGCLLQAQTTERVE